MTITKLIALERGNTANSNGADVANTVNQIIDGEQLINDLSQAYEFSTVALFKASLIEFPDGKTIRLLDRGADFTKIIGTGTANGFNIIASTSVSQSIDLINESPVNVKQWGATGDGVTDDRLAIFAAMDYVSAISGTLYFPIGDYRMTAGYTNSGANNDIRLLGEGVNRENLKTPQVGSTITLDSTNPGTFFYKQSSRHFLQVEGMIFRSAQYAGNRKYFIFDSGGAVHNFQNVNFENVEKPINYTANCYFQNAAFRDVQFRASGTFHSESNSIIGTLLLLDNVNHESTVPLNSDKVVCDLRGIREIQGTNFLLEGSLAETGWTIIRT
ncbi:MAG TPA: hypothetical protein EYN67_01600, partial [Flavobacteriales bacterium]|nr:hypothetical protein [Flavobacteriales bacterium]